MAYEDVKKMFARGHTMFRAWDSKSGNPEPLPPWLLGTTADSKPKSVWKNKEQRAAEREERLQKFLEKYGHEAPAGLDIRRLLLPARAPKPPRVKEPRPPAAPRAPRDKGPPKRRVLFPNIMAAQRCGVCASCLNPGWKKACLTRRAELEALRGAAEGGLSGDGQVAPKEEEPQVVAGDDPMAPRESPTTTSSPEGPQPSGPWSDEPDGTQDSDEASSPPASPLVPERRSLPERRRRGRGAADGDPYLWQAYLTSSDSDE